MVLEEKSVQTFMFFLNPLRPLLKRRIIGRLFETKNPANFKIERRGFCVRGKVILFQQNHLFCFLEVSCMNLIQINTGGYRFTKSIGSVPMDGFISS